MLLESTRKCGFLLQFANFAYICGFRLQLRIQQLLNFTIAIFDYFFVDLTNYSGFRKYCSGIRICAIFGAPLSGAVFKLFVCGIQNRNDDQRKVTL